MKKYLVFLLLVGFVNLSAKDQSYTDIQYSKSYVERYIYNDGTYPLDDITKVTNIEPKDSDPKMDKKVATTSPKVAKKSTIEENSCNKNTKRVIGFKRGSHYIEEDEFSTLNEAIKIANQFKECKLIIIGHADSTSSEEYNLLLSKLRALEVREHMINKNIDKKRLRIKWKGETDPIASNIMSVGREKNRRVEIIFQ